MFELLLELADYYNLTTPFARQWHPAREAPRQSATHNYYPVTHAHTSDPSRQSVLIKGPNRLTPSNGILEYVNSNTMMVACSFITKTRAYKTFAKIKILIQVGLFACNY